MSFDTTVITPLWLYVLASATPAAFGNAEICDETLSQIAAGDVSGHRHSHGKCVPRGYEVGKIARKRGAGVAAELVLFATMEKDVERLIARHSKSPIRVAAGRSTVTMPEQIDLWPIGPSHASCARNQK